MRDHVVRARFQRRFQKLVLICAGGEQQRAAVLEQERDRAIGTEIAAVFAEGMTDFGHGAHAVVGQAIDNHRGTVDAVAFVANFFVVRAINLARAALDRPLDGVLGHVVIVGFIHRQTQARIAVDAAAAHLRGDRDFLDQACSNLAFFCILAALAMLDVCPLTVTGHSDLSARVAQREIVRNRDFTKLHVHRRWQRDLSGDKRFSVAARHH